MPFTLAPKQMKYLGKVLKKFYRIYMRKNYKILMKEIREGIIK